MGKYDIKVNRAWCKNCRICIAYCPTAVYIEDELGGPIISQPDKCTNCQLCVIRCPDFAITVTPVPEPKAESKPKQFLNKLFGDKPQTGK